MRANRAGRHNLREGINPAFHILGLPGGKDKAVETLGYHLPSVDALKAEESVLYLSLSSQTRYSRHKQRFLPGKNNGASEETDVISLNGVFL